MLPAPFPKQRKAVAPLRVHNCIPEFPFEYKVEITSAQAIVANVQGFDHSQSGAEPPPSAQALSRLLSGSCRVNSHWEIHKLRALQMLQVSPNWAVVGQN